MSYSYRVYKLPKPFIDECRSCETFEDFKNIYFRGISNNQVNKDYIVEENIYPLYELGKLEYDFGETTDIEELYKHGNSLFKSLELNEEYFDYKPIVLEPSGILCAIEIYRNQIIKHYKRLANETEIYHKSQLERLRNHVEDMLDEWDNQNFPDLRPYDLSDSKNIISSWKYEYQIFELVRIYKEFDWEHYSLVFYGW